MMDQRITILPPLLANQLAAGEVIERPASIVKELVENSLDAGSTTLTLMLEQGGMKRIQVTDNGCGIHPDDLALAFARHATSKIKSASDLSQIASLGFRGEALASIGAVAKLTIASCSGDEPAHEATIAASQAVSIKPCAHPRGTTVEVRDLFYNTPARQKFLKSPRTEWLHIDELLKRLSLSRPDVSWHIYHDGKLVSRYIAKPRDIRLQQVLGKTFMEAGLPIEASITQVKLTGMIAHPEFARSSADYQYFYVNGRMVKDRVISHAIRLAYDELIYPGRYPAYVLYCELDHSLVDVNVHPTKHEVRFVQARLVHDFITQTLREALPHPNVQHQPPSTAVKVKHASLLLPLPAQPMAKPSHDLGQVIAMIGNRLVLTQHENLLYAIDWPKTLQTYGENRWRAGLEAQHITKMPLLQPIRIRKSQHEALMQSLNALGFELQSVHADECIVRAMPAFLKGMDEQRFTALCEQACDDLLPPIVQCWVASLPCTLKDIELRLMDILAFGGMRAIAYKRHTPETLL